MDGDAEESLEEVEPVEIVMITDILHHTDSPGDVLQNVFDHVLHTTRVLVAEFDPVGEGIMGPPLENRMPMEDVKSLAQKVGFEIIAEGKQEFEHYYLLLKKQTFLDNSMSKFIK